MEVFSARHLLQSKMGVARYSTYTMTCHMQLATKLTHLYLQGMPLLPSLSGLEATTSFWRSSFIDPRCKLGHVMNLRVQKIIMRDFLCDLIGHSRILELAQLAACVVTKPSLSQWLEGVARETTLVRGRFPHLTDNHESDFMVTHWFWPPFRHNLWSCAWSYVSVFYSFHGQSVIFKQAVNNLTS